MKRGTHWKPQGRMLPRARVRRCGCGRPSPCPEHEVFTTEMKEALRIVLSLTPHEFRRWLLEMNRQKCLGGAHIGEWVQGALIEERAENPPPKIEPLTLEKLEGYAGRRCDGCGEPMPDGIDNCPNQSAWPH